MNVRRTSLLALPALAGLLVVGLLTGMGADKPRADDPPKEVTNSIGMKLVLIPAGNFTMGSPKDELDRQEDEAEHEVEITRPFYLGVYEVTQEEYEKVTEQDPSGYKDKRYPVHNVSWDDARTFCSRLSKFPDEKKAGRKYRLPTEAEWEYACRAGTTTTFHFDDKASSKEANFDGDHPYGGADKGPNLKSPAAVGSYKPNAWGLYDMHGNVAELCGDWYDKEYYKNSPPKDPQGPEKGTGWVARGGSWHDPGSLCRAAARGKGHEFKVGHYEDFGFRVVCEVPKAP